MTQLIKGDCLEIMTSLADKSIDIIIADLPYGKTQNNWDKIINPKEMWKQFNRIIKTMAQFYALPNHHLIFI